jgi:hypothetical protein
MEQVDPTTADLATGDTVGGGGATTIPGLRERRGLRERGDEGGGRLANFSVATGRRHCRPAGRAAAASTGAVGGEGVEGERIAGERARNE